MANALWAVSGYPRPSYVGLEDLRQIGFLAVLAARNRFDPSVCPVFSVYAKPRVYGAMLDYLRDVGHWRASGRVPRVQAMVDVPDSRDQFAAVDDADQIEACLTRTADAPMLRELFLRGKTQAQVAKTLGTSPASVSRRMNAALDACRKA